MSTRESATPRRARWRRHGPRTNCLRFAAAAVVALLSTGAVAPVRASTARVVVDEAARVRESLERSRALVEDAAVLGVRRATSYSNAVSARSELARMRATELYRLVRGGWVRFLFEADETEAPMASRIALARTIEGVLQREVDELTTAVKARSELVEEVAMAANDLVMYDACARFLDAASELHRVALGPTTSGARPSSSGPLRLTPPVPGRVVVGFSSPTPASGALSGFEGGQGIELRATRGEAVHAALPGQVVYAGRVDGYETMVVIQHDAVTYTATGRLFDPRVRVGDRVDAATVLGVADPGPAMGPRGRTVYFELRQAMASVDPWPRFLRVGAPSEPPAVERFDAP